jgi:hypothetical protein
MNPSPCISIQEEIAWGRTLTPEAQLHVLSCPACKQLSLEFSRLDSVYASTGSDIQVPSDFVARVMAKVKKPNEGLEINFGSSLVARVSAFFQLRPVQITVALWLAFSMNRAF